MHTIEVITLQFVKSIIQVWYEYNDAEVKMSNFSKMNRGVRTVKVDVQQAATLLFYIRRQPIEVDASIGRVDDNDDGSTNSTDKSRTSKFSDIANDKVTTHSNAQNKDDIDDDRQIEGNMTTGLDQDQVCVFVISAPIILYHIVHFTDLFVIHSCSTFRRL
jgi:hypothetical protein